MDRPEWSDQACNWKKYRDEKAAMEKREGPFKKPLTTADNLFVHYLTQKKKDMWS